MLYKPRYHLPDLVRVLVQQLTNVNERGQVEGLVVRHQPRPCVHSQLGLPWIWSPEILLVVANRSVQDRGEQLVPALGPIVQ